MPPTANRSKDMPDQKGGNWGLAFSFPVTHRPKARRTSTRRVRTGCITCEKRHVKCDEAKPSCQRCLKRHGFCEGYSQESSPTKEDEAQSDGKLVVKGSRPSLPNKPSEILFSNQADQESFSIWGRMSTILDGGLFSPDLYSTYMYQIAHQEPCLRHAIVALGSMRMALQSTDLSQEAFGSVVKQSPHYRNAVSNYARAMRLVYSLTNDERGTRNAILCCILFIAFEALNHNHASAMQHFHHGQSILRHYIAQAQESLRKPTKAGKPCSPISEEVSPVEATPATKEGSPPLATESSPVPRVISHDVIQFFYHLDVHVWLRSMMQPQEPTRGLMSGFMEVEDPSDDMPIAFGSTEEARNWLGMVQLYAAHFSRHLAELRVPLTKKARKNGTQLPVLSDVPNWHELSIPYAGALTRWSGAFQTIYKKTRQEKTTNITAYLQVTHMQIMYLFTYVAISCAFFSDYPAMRNEEPRFVEMLDLCEDVLRDTPKTDAEPFTLNNGPVVALFIVTTKSRFHATRARAVELLRQFPRRDGLWDSRAVLAIGEWNNKLERKWDEAGVTNVEHWNKLKERNATIEHNEGPRIFVHAPRKNVVTGAWYNESEILQW